MTLCKTRIHCSRIRTGRTIQYTSTVVYQPPPLDRDPTGHTHGSPKSKIIRHICATYRTPHITGHRPRCHTLQRMTDRHDYKSYLLPTSLCPLILFCFYVITFTQIMSLNIQTRRTKKTRLMQPS